MSMGLSKYRAPSWVLRCVASSSAVSNTVGRPPRRGYRPLRGTPGDAGWRISRSSRPKDVLENAVVSPRRLSRRYLSSSSFRSNEPASNENDTGTLPYQTPYARLSPVLQALPGLIDWGVAYGSGVIAQANPTSRPSLTDFLIATPDPVEFHARNLEKHPTHYPFYARWGGGNAIARWQERWGAGVWYVTNVRLCGMEIKYGVISTSRLKSDLESWETLYVAGRLHKPVLPLRIPRSLEPSLTQNLRAALSLALLHLPQEFTEMGLWEEIAGISYSGDPRMSVPGAENPQKVKNIVRGPGVREGFREMYGELLRSMQGVDLDAIRWKDDAASSEKAGEGMIIQSNSAAHRISLFQALPPGLQTSVVRQLSPASSPSFDLERIVSDPRFKETLQAEVGKIIRRPALTQSLKGLFTAGPSKSFWYGLAKVRKWWAGRSRSSS